jgi:tetratricopeptide (TPR) repeat protein
MVMNNMKKSSLLFILPIFSGILVFCEPDYYSPQAVYNFADWLYEEGDYKRAVGEYLRYLFICQKQPDDTIIYRIASCYQKTGEHDKAIMAFNRLITEYPASELYTQAHYGICYSLFKSGRYEDSLALIEAALDTVNGNDQFLLLKGVNLLYLNQYLEAYTVWEAYNTKAYNATDNFRQKLVAQELLELTDKALNPDQKSPVLAVLLSAVIPGSGKMYAGHAGDGLFSLITIGIFGGMAAYSFYEEGLYSVKAWIYASIGGLFYLGDVYGSAVAAIRYNDTYHRDIVQQIRSTVELNIQ